MAVHQSCARTKMSKSCSQRFASLVRKGVERVLAIPPRTWLALSIVAVVIAATAVHQYFEYAAMLPEHQKIYEDMLAFNETCTLIQKNHFMAYLRMEADCQKAKVIIQFTPQWRTISALVNSSWPHADNIVEWTVQALGKIFSSLQSAAIFVAILIAFWPSVKQRSFGFMKDEINRHKADRIDKELQKMAKTRAYLTAFNQHNNQLQQTPCAQKTGDF